MSTTWACVRKHTLRAQLIGAGAHQIFSHERLELVETLGMLDQLFPLPLQLGLLQLDIVSASAVGIDFVCNQCTNEFISNFGWTYSPLKKRLSPCPGNAMDVPSASATTRQTNATRIFGQSVRWGRALDTGSSAFIFVRFIG